MHAYFIHSQASACFPLDSRRKTRIFRLIRGLFSQRDSSAQQVWTPPAPHHSPRLAPPTVVSRARELCDWAVVGRELCDWPEHQQQAWLPIITFNGIAWIQTGYLALLSELNSSLILFTFGYRGRYVWFPTFIVCSANIEDIWRLVLCKFKRSRKKSSVKFFCDMCSAMFWFLYLDLMLWYGILNCDIKSERNLFSKLTDVNEGVFIGHKIVTNSSSDILDFIPSMWYKISIIVVLCGFITHHKWLFFGNSRNWYFW